MREDLIICRCEQVSLREIQEAVADGALTARQVKLATRAGMGFCQGRTCRHLVAQLVGPEPVAEHDPSARPPGTMAYKPPVRPVTFGRLAGEGKE